MHTLAHPLVGSPPLPVAPAVLAAVTVVLVAVVATRVRASQPAGQPPPTEPGGWRVATRALAAAVLVLLVAVARLGPRDEPSNLAAVTVLNVAWPLLLVLAAVLGAGVWRALDPFRALGSVERLAAPSAPPPGARGDVRVGAVLAAAWAFFLVEHGVRVDPRALATALAAYALLLVAGSVAVGRDRWLPSADAAGLLVTWTGRLRHGGLRTWSPPAGAAALLGAAFGGTAFARLRLTSAWGAWRSPRTASSGPAWPASPRSPRAPRSRSRRRRGRGGGARRAASRRRWCRSWPRCRWRASCGGR
jgi:hypothetical protein